MKTTEYTNNDNWGNIITCLTDNISVTAKDKRTTKKMKTIKWLFIVICMFTFEEIYSQNNFTAILKDKVTNEALIGATAVLEGTVIGSSTDFDGKLTITGIPDGKKVIVFSYVGYETFKDTFEFPLTIPQPYIALLQSGMDLETVQISATRNSRSIEDIPTRTEAITAEELGEKAAMNSTNISMLLRESTGIMVQQTSANSGNQTLRIQGLDGRYTQLLKDGFPLYSGFSSGLSVMQVPPLDLRQVEVIKGSASTLYGGGAIAGLVNLVSKQPVENEPELSFMLNQTSARGTTANTFWSQRFKKQVLHSTPRLTIKSLMTRIMTTSLTFPKCRASV